MMWAMNAIDEDDRLDTDEARQVIRRAVGTSAGSTRDAIRRRRRRHPVSRVSN